MTYTYRRKVSSSDRLAPLVAFAVTLMFVIWRRPSSVHDLTPIFAISPMLIITILKNWGRQEVVVGPEGITFHSFGTRKIAWADIASIQAVHGELGAKNLQYGLQLKSSLACSLPILGPRGLPIYLPEAGAPSLQEAIQQLAPAHICWTTFPLTLDNGEARKVLKVLVVAFALLMGMCLLPRLSEGRYLGDSASLWAWLGSGLLAGGVALWYLRGLWSGKKRIVVLLGAFIIFITAAPCFWELFTVLPARLGHTEQVVFQAVATTGEERWQSIHHEPELSFTVPYELGSPQGSERVFTVSTALGIRTIPVAQYHALVESAKARR